MTAAQTVSGTEIVAVDAMQVYRGMDIGTAKPTASDRAVVTHHGLDLAEPSERFTVADYQRAVRPVVEGEGPPLVLVAGTGLYLTALVDRLELPGEFPAVRAELERLADEPHGAHDLYRRLAGLDPAAADRIEPGNVRRVVRALEVTIGSGRPFSSFGPGVSAFAPTDVTLVGLRRSRDELGRRIRRRVTAMIEGGLVDEVRGVLERPGGVSPTAGQALGYKEIAEHLSGVMSLDDAAELTVTRTRRFAARQDRWFRRDPRIRWVDVRGDDDIELLGALVAGLSTA